MNKLLYDGFHKIEEINTLIKGKEVKREKLHLKSAVSAIVTDLNGRIALVKQDRPCVGKYLYEIPAGVLDKNGLTPQQVLMEELQEECELDCNKISMKEQPYMEYYMVCGSTDATMQMFECGYNDIGVNKTVNDRQVESVEWFSYNEMCVLKELGYICDPKTLFAMQKVCCYYG